MDLSPMMQAAFVLLCIAQIIHFSKHWWQLTSTMTDIMRAERMRRAIGWKKAIKADDWP